MPRLPRLTYLRLLATGATLLLALAAACGGDDGAGSATSTTVEATVEATAAAPPAAGAPSATATAPPTTGPAPPTVTTTLPPALGEPDAARAFEHLRVLVEEIGVRVSASDEERSAAAYIAAQLEDAGYAVTLEPFAVEVTRDESAVTLPNGEELESAVVLSGSPNGADAGPLVHGGLGSAADIAGVEAAGAVLLLDRGVITFAEKALNAEAAGAVAVIIVNNRPGSFRGSLGDAAVAVPVVGVAPDDGATLDRLAAGGESVTVRAEVRTSTEQSQNVVGRASGECDAYLGAHYDSVQAGPGANDNASGTAAMIELARSHLTAGLCAIAFGSEESGLWGSRAFVESHDLRDARFMLNFDMVAKITSPIFVATDGDRDSRELADRATAIADELGMRIPRGAFPAFASSDHASFAAAGVPAITVHSGDDPLIHRPSDDLDNVSPDDLAAMLRVAAAVLDALLAE